MDPCQASRFEPKLSFFFVLAWVKTRQGCMKFSKKLYLNYISIALKTKSESPVASLKCMVLTIIIEIFFLVPHMLYIEKRVLVVQLDAI